MGIANRQVPVTIKIDGHEIEILTNDFYKYKEVYFSLESKVYGQYVVNIYFKIKGKRDKGKTHRVIRAGEMHKLQEILESQRPHNKYDQSRNGKPIHTENAQKFIENFTGKTIDKLVNDDILAGNYLSPEQIYDEEWMKLLIFKFTLGGVDFVRPGVRVNR